MACSNSCYGETAAVGYGYDTPANGSRLLTMTYPSGYILHYGYNAGLDGDISRLSFLADDNGSGGVGQHTEEYSYLGLNTIVVRNRPEEQTQLTYVQQTGDPLANTDAGDRYTGLDRFGRVIDQYWLNLATMTASVRFQYGYDRDGNVLFKNDLVTPTNSELYGYDNLNRLTSFEVGTLSADHTSIPVPTYTWTVSLDSIGNRNTVTTNGTPTNSTFNSQNEQTAFGANNLTYDNAGDMTKDQNGNTGYDYDAWGRLRISGSATNDYFYDALGRRVLSDGTEWLIYSGNQVIEDRHVHSDGFGGIVVDSIDRQVWGSGYIDQMVLRDHVNESTNTTTRDYSLQDANYNTVAITTNTGMLIDRFAYDQNGAIRVGNPSGDGWVYLWQGLIQVSVSDGTHPATVLYDGRSRFYNPQLGTWTTPDHGGYIDGMNLYQAYDSNGVGNIDPYGFAPVWSQPGGYNPNGPGGPWEGSPYGPTELADGTIIPPRGSPLVQQPATGGGAPGHMTPAAEGQPNLGGVPYGTYNDPGSLNNGVPIFPELGPDGQPTGYGYYFSTLDGTYLPDPLGQRAPVFAGFGAPRYQEHDALIENLVRDFNLHKRDYCGCTSKQETGVPDLSAAVVKSWLIQETGGNSARSRAAWQVDPAQVNVPGDWNAYKTDLGLAEPQRRNEGDILKNLKAALKYLCRKGFGQAGQPARSREGAFFDDWRTALTRYGPGGARYANRILQRAANPSQSIPIEGN